MTETPSYQPYRNKANPKEKVHAVEIANETENKKAFDFVTSFGDDPARVLKAKQFTDKTIAIGVVMKGSSEYLEFLGPARQILVREPDGSYSGWNKDRFLNIYAKWE